MKSLIVPPEIAAEVSAGLGLSLVEAAHRVPAYRPGKATHAATIWRWVLTGIRLPDGSRLHLEACRLGGRWLTSEAAISRFIAAQTPATSTAPTPPVHTPRQRQRSATKASERLDRIGI